MENASKALIMAGGVLIAILLLTFFVYILNVIGAHTARVYEDLEASEISEFNQKFLNYDGRDDLKIQDVVTIVGLAIDNNITGKIQTETAVYVDENNDGNFTQDENWAKEGNTSEKILQGHIADVINGTQYICEVNVNEKTTIVDEIKIRRVEIDIYNRYINYNLICFLYEIYGL